MRFLLWSLFLCGFLPVSAHAAVLINEVAWMGGQISPNHEWIELYNSGGAVDVTDWILESNGGLRIMLSGTLQSNSYAVLERTSDESAAGDAFLLYTGALKNSGETLYLYRSDGGLEDQVAGGENWENIGGDNDTKASAQYTTNGWVTASPTPGKMNALKTEVVEAVVNTQGSSQLAEPAVRTEDVQKLELPPVGLQLKVEGPENGFVNQPINFTVEASGIGETLINSLSYTWNFGDGVSSEGIEPDHTFLYPGTYIVNVYGEYARQHAIGRHEITILPIAISLTTNRDGDVQVNNNSPYEIDLSDFRIRGDEVFRFPDYTSLLAGQTITIPKNILGDIAGKMIGLYDQTSTLQASILPASRQIVPRTVVDSPAERSINPVSFQYAPVENKQIDEVETVQEDKGGNVPTEERIQKEAVNWPFGVMIVLLIVAIGGVLMKPLPNKDSLDRHE